MRYATSLSRALVPSFLLYIGIALLPAPVLAATLPGTWLSNDQATEIALTAPQAFYALGSPGFGLARTIRIEVDATAVQGYGLYLYVHCTSDFQNPFQGGSCRQYLHGSPNAVATTTASGRQFLTFPLQFVMPFMEGSYYGFSIEPLSDEPAQPIGFYGSRGNTYPDGFLSSDEAPLAIDGWFEVSELAYATTSTDPSPPEDEGSSSVLFLPGIKGSRLYDGAGQKRWEPFGDGDIAALALDADGKSVRDDIHAHEGDVIGSVAFKDIYGSFSDFMDDVKEAGTIADWRAAAYDWRLSLADIVRNGTPTGDRISYAANAEESYLRETLEALAASSRTGKATIVAHSNGGLVAKALLASLGDAEAARLVDKVILIGVPQQGAPQALAALLYGYKEGLPWWFPGIVSTDAARTFAENAPMAYHLLPSPGYFASTPSGEAPLVSFDAGLSYAEERARYGSTLDSFEELAAYALAEDGGRTRPLPIRIDQANVLNPNLIAYAREVHALLDAWTPPEGIEVYQLAGTGEETIAGIAYYERCLFTLCRKLYRPVFTKAGDGVVPDRSATAMRAPAYRIDLEPGGSDHGTMLGNESLQGVVASLIQNETPRTGRGVFADAEHERDDSSLRIFLHSPLAMQIIDKDGSRTGLGADGTHHSEVAGARYGRLGGMQYLLAPASSAYTLSLDGNAEEMLLLEIEEVHQDGSIEEVVFDDTDLSSTTRLTLEIDPGLSLTESIRIESDDALPPNEVLPDEEAVQEREPMHEHGKSRSGGSMRTSTEPALALLYERLLELLFLYIELLKSQSSRQI